MTHELDDNSPFFPFDDAEDDPNEEETTTAPDTAPNIDIDIAPQNASGSLTSSPAISETLGAEPTENAISDRDRVIAQALARGRSHTEAGAAVGVSAKTVQRRLRDPQFIAAVTEERQRHFEQIAGQLSSLTTQALQVLSDVMAGKSNSERLRAASAVLGQAARYHSQLSNFDLDRHLEEIDAALVRLQSQKGGEA
jgi:hypothetical protein